MDLFNIPNLPLDIAREFILLLDWRDIIRAKRVNKSWLYECSREQLWQCLYKRKFRKSIILSLAHPNKPTYEWLFVARSREITWFQPQGWFYRKEGLGTFYNGDGCRTIGEFKYDEDGYFGLHGFGLAQYDDGSLYEGGWENSRKNGFGVHKLCCYDTEPEWTYRGEWEDNARCGKGEITSRDGRTYSGVFSTEKNQIWGVLLLPCGERFEGSFFLHDGTGNGILENRTRMGIYIGEYRGTTHLHGRGQFTWPNGDRFIGTWENGNR
eukprot:TRINITY_DN2563_c0_g1_i1.p1 TRINITY_DN2563_c0_g1~~TRINITY_DN2563_c0_g1_i1.p1  ORF type:complete len:267 (-),score=13.48 TRINITY_DN2563_c0_g1_i1:295-1095(-)